MNGFHQEMHKLVCDGKCTGIAGITSVYFLLIPLQRLLAGIISREIPDIELVTHG